MLFSCKKKKCCNSCCNSCCGHHDHGAAAPAASGETSAPVPPAPMADPSAAMPRRTVRSASFVR
jgi:hypothetical protein